MGKKKSVNKTPKKQKTPPAKMAVRIMCIILALLMVGGGAYYLVQYIISSLAG